MVFSLMGDEMEFLFQFSYGFGGGGSGDRWEHETALNWGNGCCC